ncbi:MAG: AzlD domain-containing protein [Pseudomonadota bacterium]
MRSSRECATLGNSWVVIFVLAGATFAIRLSGVYLGRQLPQRGSWSRALNALPGSLVIALVSVSLLSGGPREWIAGGVATAVAATSRNLPLTMGSGILAVWLLRLYA